uniref:Transmembrane protein n=1 Tax=Heterorhabditis bacteriophora TaxID=37862 RepID=A0A1I7W942_HETBA
MQADFIKIIVITNIYVINNKLINNNKNIQINNKLINIQINNKYINIYKYTYNMLLIKYNYIQVIKKNYLLINLKFHISVIQNIFNNVTTNNDSLPETFSLETRLALIFYSFSLLVFVFVFNCFTLTGGIVLFNLFIIFL